MGWTGWTLDGLEEDEGGDLALVDGALIGIGTSPESDADAQDGLGSVFRHITAIWAAEESATDASLPSILIELRTSEDGITWTDYAEYGEGDFLCQYLQWRVTIKGDTVFGQLPKLTRFEANAPAADSVPWQGNVQSTEVSPPAGSLFGSRYLVGAGVGAWAGKDGQIAVCQCAEDLTFRFIPPIEGIQFYHEADAEVKLYDATGVWVSNDSRKTAPFRQHCAAQAYHALIGNFAFKIDVAQDSNMYMENATAGSGDADYIEYKVGLKVGTYDLILMTCMGPNCGNHDIRLEELTVPVIGTLDEYAVGFARNVRRVVAGFSIAVAGTYTLRIKTNGKNAASTGYDSYVSWVAIVPT
ncbi:MAG: DUF2793 domain-containing protein [bacterium]